MKKILIFVMSIIIIMQSYAIYKLCNTVQPKITKEIVTSAPPKIIYKDKIIYKTNPIDEKIVYQTKMFLHLMINGQDRCTNVDFMENFNIENCGNGIDRGLENKSYLLNDITEYNKSHAGINQ